MNRKFKKGLAIVLALAMVFAMTATAFASTNGTATITIQYYDAEAGSSEIVDSVDVASGSTLKDTIDATFNTDERPYEPVWTDDVDYYTQEPTKRLTSFISLEERNVDHQYKSDNSGWSKDWGWMYTVNGTLPTFPNEPNHGKMMDQYTIQNGDNIVIKYVYVETAWDSTGATIYNIVHE